MEQNLEETRYMLAWSLFQRSYTECVWFPPARSCHSMCEMSGKLTRDSVSRFTLRAGHVSAVSLAGTKSSRHPEGKQVFSINRIIQFMSSKSLLRVLGMMGGLLKFEFPDASQGWANFASRFLQLWSVLEREWLSFIQRPGQKPTGFMYFLSLAQCLAHRIPQRVFDGWMTEWVNEWGTYGWMACSLAHRKTVMWIWAEG